MIFVYTAADLGGRQLSGELQAGDSHEALELLAGRQLTPLTLAPKRAGAPAGGFGKSAATGGHKASVNIMREMATLATSGVPLMESLKALQDANQDSTLAATIEKLIREIHDGASFSKALGASALELPNYVLALISAGEASGELGFALSRCADQMEFDQKIRAQTIEALIYPAILVGTGGAAILFIFSFVVPKFSALLSGKKVNLPWISEWVLAIGMFISRNQLAVFSGLAILVLLVIALFRSPLRFGLLAGLQKLPVISSWFMSRETARWTSTLAVLLQTKVPILTSLELAAQAVGSAQIRARLNQVQADVQRGGTLSGAVQTHQLLDGTSLSMIKIGETSGRLPEMFTHISAYWNDANRAMQARMIALIEPASIIVLGIVIGTVMVGVILAITSLTEVKL